MSSKQSPKSKSEREVKTVESVEAHGHSILIRAVGPDKQQRHQLFIDGKRVPFVEAEDGYIVGYTHGKTLLEAAERFAQRRYDVATGEGGER